jgi:hypothetical protein
MGQGETHPLILARRKKGSSRVLRDTDVVEPLPRPVSNTPSKCEKTGKKWGKTGPGERV